ncbi:hypothetical protein ACT9XH_03970 [Methanococcoides methylutens]|uniref:hypothetical protein n=1 Tax=Methanococcoides methylutens TaxID=2226 RepID=UPI004044AF33
MEKIVILAASTPDISKILFIPDLYIKHRFGACTYVMALLPVYFYPNSTAGVDELCRECRRDTGCAYHISMMFEPNVHFCLFDLMNWSEGYVKRYV